jgi:hypothetical protein
VAAGEPLREIALSYAFDHSTISEGAESSAKSAGWPRPARDSTFLINGNFFGVVRDCLGRSWFECRSAAGVAVTIYLDGLACRICCGLV